MYQTELLWHEVEINNSEEREKLAVIWFEVAELPRRPNNYTP